MKENKILFVTCGLICVTSAVDAKEADGLFISKEAASYIATVCGSDEKMIGDTRSDEQRKQEAEIRKEEFKTVSESVFFKESAELAAKTIVMYCSGRSRATLDLYDSIIAVAEKLEKEASNDGIDWQSVEEEGTVGIKGLIDYVKGESKKGVQIANIKHTIRSIDRPVRLTSGDLISTPESQDQCDAAVSRLAAGTDCNEYLKEFSDIYKAVHTLYASADAAIAAAQLMELDNHWSQFMNETVDQTPLELWWNGRLFRQKHKGYRGFVSPPKWQHVLLKPYVAVDWVGDAPDGSQVQEAVVLDIWGLKRWDARQTKWYKPIGGSIHIAASDRANQEDWGVGLSVHFTEMHTIGITSYDGEVGVFLSFDLWKNATDKYQTADKRIEEFRTLKEEIEADPLEAFLKKAGED